LLVYTLLERAAHCLYAASEGCPLLLRLLLSGAGSVRGRLSFLLAT